MEGSYLHMRDDPQCSPQIFPQSRDGKNAEIQLPSGHFAILSIAYRVSRMRKSQMQLIQKEWLINAASAWFVVILQHEFFRREIKEISGEIINSHLIFWGR